MAVLHLSARREARDVRAGPDNWGQEKKLYGNEGLVGAPLR